MKRTAPLYLLIVSIVGLGIFFMLHAGSQLPAPVSPVPIKPVAAASSHPVNVGGSSVATVGKLGGSALAARFTGMKWHESLQLGALMNTRGLMELIALNIGYDMGILSQRIFTMLVIMALVITIMTGPLVTFFEKARQVSRAKLDDAQPA